MQAPILRPYQERDLQRVRDLFRTHQSVIRQLPTGGGKGTEAAYLTYHATKNGKRVLFIVDRRALVLDFSENRLDRLGVPHGIIMGNHPKRNAWLNTHVASIDTLARRLEQLPKADLILVDECRFSMSPKWQAVLSRYPASTKILGFDATPVAPGGKGLGDRYQAMVQGPSVRELINEGFLKDGRIYTPSDQNKSGLKMKGDDFTPASLESVCATKQMVGNTVDEYKNRCPDRKALFFGVHQKHAFEEAEAFRCAGINWAYMDANTPQGDIHTPHTRKWITHNYEHGDLRGISSVAVLQYGVDFPICSCVILGRAVGSMPLLRQIIGRAVRPHPSVKDFVVHDHWGSCRDLNVAFDDDVEWNLDGTTKKITERDTISMSTCKRCRQNFRTGPKVCPYCGVVIEKQIREVEAVAGELVEFKKKAMTPAEWQAKVQGNARFRQLTELYAVQSQRGYKSGYAAMAFKNMFGAWPPKGWLELMKVGGDSAVE